jgi:hypothetical protein
MLSTGTANVVTKSGTTSARSKARRAGGGGPGGISAGSGSGIGSGSGGNIVGGDRNVGGGGPGGGGGGAASPSSPPVARTRIALADEDLSAVKLSPEDAKRRELLTKLHPSVLAVIERLQRKEAQPSADEMKYVRDGKAEVQIWLIDKSAESLDELKKLGFEIILDPKTAKVVIGRLPLENLQKLAGLKSVRYVAPQKS